jgi:putative ABC transport system permease protein
VSPGNLLHLYRVRLRARVVQECFAIVGIAAGVALLFASQVATQSLSGSVAQLSQGIVGDASLQLLARDPHGFDQAALRRVRALPGVRAAAPLLEASALAIGPHGRESVELVGADASLRRLGGTLVHRTELSPFAGVQAIALPAPLAHRLGVVRFGQEASFQLYGRQVRVPLYEQLRKGEIGALIDSPVAVASLETVQAMTGLPGRVSRILIVPVPGREGTVRAGLLRLAASLHGVNVHGTGYDEKLFARAASASNQSTLLFALISALVGFLFAFNAMLLTVPQRRRLIATLRREGYPAASVTSVVLLDATLLGVLACALGLLLGEELSLHLFGSNPGYLSSAFALGSQRVVGWQSFAVAIAGGLLAALVAVLSPLRELRSGRPPASDAPDELLSGPGASTGAHVRSPPSLALVALSCLLAASVILLAAPKLAVLAMVLLIGALLLALPLPLTIALASVRGLAPRITSAVPHVAVMELRAARTRALAITATGAIAVFGAVSIQSAHGDLLKGLENAARDMNPPGGVWVAPPGAYNLLQIAPFAPTVQSKLARLPGVASVRAYRGGLLDWGDRRTWVIAPPSNTQPLLPATQIVKGDLTLASARVKSGGWAVLSAAIAEEHDLHLGSSFLLPAPRPLRLRVAALSTNIGWPPGTMIVSAADYARAWGSTDVSALELTPRPGVSAARLAGEIRSALGPQSALAVYTTAAHAARQNALSRQGLTRLSQIATLILIVAILAMAAAMGTMVFQRRPRLAKLKLEGFTIGELWRTIVLESILLVAVGSLAGAVFGLYGQQLLDRALAHVIGFPVVYSLGAVTALGALALVTAASVLAVALPGYLATGVSPALALQD